MLIKFLLVIFSIVMVLSFSILIIKRSARKNKRNLFEAENLIATGQHENALRILDHISLASRYDDIGEKANYLSSVCLEALGKNLEASYAYATYLAKFPKGKFVGESEHAFKQLWNKFGPFDYQALSKQDKCGFVIVEQTLKRLTQ